MSELSSGGMKTLGINPFLPTSPGYILKYYLIPQKSRLSTSLFQTFNYDPHSHDFLES